MIQDTSLIAYEKALPKMPKSRRIIYETILKHPEGLTNAEIRYYTGKTINRITGRTFELREAKLIYDAGVRTCRVTTPLRTRGETWGLEAVKKLDSGGP